MADTFPDNDLGGLVEAATAAAGGHELSWADTVAVSAQLDNDLVHATIPAHAGHPIHRPRYSSPPGSRKRKLTQVRDASPQGQYTEYDDSSDVSRNDDDAADASANAGDSFDPLAATLWREPIRREGSRVSRPSMSKLFSIMGLSAENFLKLQSDAKDFMLDKNHLDRRDVVGKRGKGDHADMIRLKLMKYIEEFLEGGAGDKHFGPDTEDSKAAAHPTVWPDEKDHIVTQCMPLCRRMVTNEAQRLYALEKRQRNSKRKKSEHGRKSATSVSDPILENSPEIPGDNYSPDSEEGALHRIPQTETLEGPTDSLTAQLEKSQLELSGDRRNGGFSDISSAASNMHHEPSNNMVLHVNMISGDYTEIKSAKRLMPRFALGAEFAKGLGQLTEEVKKRYNAVELNNARRHFNVKVWLPDGFVHVKDDGEWIVALLSAGMVDWMDGEVKVLIEA